MTSVVQSVEEIECGKKLVIIDGIYYILTLILLRISCVQVSIICGLFCSGVGYPAVGSICGISNADSANALNASVLLVGKSGVGDAVDSFNLNARYVTPHQNRVAECI